MERKKNGGKKSEESIQDLWHIIKWSNKDVIGALERKGENRTKEI